MPTYHYIGPVTAVTNTQNMSQILLPNQRVNVSGNDVWLLRLLVLKLLVPLPPLMLDGSWTLNGVNNLDGEVA